MAGGEPLNPTAPVISQVSAWNRLKDPAGVVRMFAEFVAPESPAHLVLAGPAVKWIPAETEAEAVYNETVESLGEFPPAIRERVHIIALPNDDPGGGGGDRERAPTPIRRGSPEEPGRGVRACRDGGDVEAPARGLHSDRRAPGPGARWRDRIPDRAGRRRGRGSDDLDASRRSRACALYGTGRTSTVAEQFLLPHDIPRWIAVMEFAYSRTPAPQHA